MNCYIYEDLLPLYVDGGLSAQSEAEVKAHLGSCEHCRALEAELRTAAQGEAPVRAPQKPFRKVRRRWVASLIIAALLAAVIIAPLAVLGAGEIRGEGLAFSNIGMISRADRFFGAIEKGDYAAAVDSLDTHEIYAYASREWTPETEELAYWALGGKEGGRWHEITVGGREYRVSEGLYGAAEQYLADGSDATFWLAVAGGDWLLEPEDAEKLPEGTGGVNRASVDFGGRTVECGLTYFSVISAYDSYRLIPVLDTGGVYPEGDLNGTSLAVYLAKGAAAIIPEDVYQAMVRRVEKDAEELKTAREEARALGYEGFVERLRTDLAGQLTELAAAGAEQNIAWLSHRISSVTRADDGAWRIAADIEVGGTTTGRDESGKPFEEFYSEDALQYSVTDTGNGIFSITGGAAGTQYGEALDYYEVIYAALYSNSEI